MNIAVILSAGSGTRFKSDVPKQLLELNNTKIINYSLRKFHETPFIEEIIVVSHPDYIEHLEKIGSKFSKLKTVIAGGDRRQDSVFNALKWIRKEYRDTKKVFIHDSARPLFSQKLLEELYIASKTNTAVIPVIALEDTIKTIKDELVTETLDRRNIVRAQTPQVFDFEKIYDCYANFPKELTATDDSFVAEFCGVQVAVIDGEKDNIKITYPEDIRLAEHILKNGLKYSDIKKD